MRRLYCAMILTLAFMLPAAASAQSIDWPQFRFDDKHFRRQSIGTHDQSNETPRRSVSPGRRNSAIGRLLVAAVVDGVVYIGSTDGTLWAYPADGCGQSFCDTPLWQSTNLAQIMDTPTVANGVVYIGSQTDQNNNAGRLRRVRRVGCGKTVCAPLWQGVAGDQSILESSPAVADGARLCRRFRRQTLCVQCGWLRQSVVQAALDGTDRCFDQIHTDGLQRACLCRFRRRQPLCFQGEGVRDKGPVKPNGPARSAARSFNRRRRS